VFYARSTPLAGQTARGHLRRTISALLLTALVTTATVTVVTLPRPAGADQIADLQAQARTISQQLVQQQLQVGAFRQQYSIASAKVEADGQAIAQIGQQIGQDQQLISAKAGLVRRQAIRSYMDYGTGTSGSTSGLFSGSQETAQAASEYSSIAVGNVTTALDQLQTAQGALQTHQATLRQQQAQDQSDQAQRAADLGQADSSQTQLESLHAQVTGQLATAVAAQAAAQSSAAAAAVAAAQRAGKDSSSRAPSSTGSAPASAAGSPAAAPTGAGGSDPALNSFLQCVVQAESGGDYQAVSPDGLYMGAFQFSQPTWDSAAQAAGRPDLVGVAPNTASKADQDTVAVALYALDGQRPWLGDRCSSQ
jgi:peptidoglycan hydrolase CwlO-like protein